MDAALTPVADDDEDKLALFTHNDAARKSVERTIRLLARGDGIYKGGTGGWTGSTAA